MPWTVVKFLIPVPQAALLNHRPVELKLSRLTDPKASLSVTSVQVVVEDCNPNQRISRTDIGSVRTPLPTMMSPAFRALTFVRLLRPCSVRYMARSMTSKTPLLVTPNALQQLRSSADVNILDASWFMPNTPRDASKEFIEKRIPDARYLDLDEVAAPSELGFKHMMPSSQVFADALGTLIGNPVTQHNAELMIP